MSYLTFIDWLGLGAFALEVLLAVLLFLCLCGHFPLAQQQPEFNLPAGRLLLAVSVLTCAAAVLLAIGFALRRLPVPSAVIAAGLALLAAPLVLQRLPARFVDGRGGLAVLTALVAALGYVIARM